MLLNKQHKSYLRLWDINISYLVIAIVFFKNTLLLVQRSEMEGQIRHFDKLGYFALVNFWLWLDILSEQNQMFTF